MMEISSDLIIIGTAVLGCSKLCLNWCIFSIKTDGNDV